jgi:hypothetical protein
LDLHLSRSVGTHYVQLDITILTNKIFNVKQDFQESRRRIGGPQRLPEAQIVAAKSAMGKNDLQMTNKETAP